MKVVPAIVSMLGMLGVSQGRTKKQTMESIGESDKGPSLSNLLREGVRLSKIEHDRNMLRYQRQIAEMQRAPIKQVGRESGEKESGRMNTGNRYKTKEDKSKESVSSLSFQKKMDTESYKQDL